MPASSLEDTVNAIGYAKVIVTLRPAAAAATTSNIQAEGAIENHFIIPSEPQAESLALSARLSASYSFRRTEPSASRRVRVYQNLGLAIGYVDADGLAALEADPQIEKVVKAPELSLIRPRLALRNYQLGHSALLASDRSSQAIVLR
jgi:subtilisin